MADGGGGSRIELRRMLPADIPAVAAIHAASWRAAYADLLSRAELNALTPTRLRRRWLRRLQRRGRGGGYTVGLLGEDVRGYCVFKAASDERSSGIIHELYVHPDAWGRGLGTALLHGAWRRMRRAGLTRVRLWVLEENLPARAFYDRHGMSWDGTRRMWPMHRYRLPALRYERSLPPADRPD